MDEKYVKAFERLKDFLKDIGLRIEKIASDYYVCGNISESDTLTFGRTGISVIIAKDEYRNDTYVTTERKILCSLIKHNKITQFNLKCNGR